MRRLLRSAHVLLAALWVALGTPPMLSMASDDPPIVAFAESDTCAACHAAEYEEWNTSKHAGAFSDTFQAFWRERDQAPACLACHTTGFQAPEGTYAFQGVSCEGCHGPLNPGHPDDAPMPLPMDSTMCMTCHRQTYMEWQLSGHAKRNIRCFDCHAVHRQGLRQEHVEDQCGACHVQRLEDFAHATHHMQGLTCSTCHMPRVKSTGIGGTGAPGHSFFVGADTCAACHEETMHRSHKLRDTLGGQVDRLTKQSSDREEQLRAALRNAEAEVDVAKNRTPKVAFGALVIGLLLGVLSHPGAWRRRNGERMHGPPDQPA